MKLQKIVRKHGRGCGSRRGLNKRHAGVAQPAAMLGRMAVELIEGGGLGAHDGAHQQQD